MAEEIGGSVQVGLAEGTDREWCAQLMATNEPWLTLRIGVEQTRASVARQGMELFLARNGMDRLGFVLVDPSGLAGAPYVKAIAVAPAARRKGIASLLLRFAEEHFAARRHLFLCVSDFNVRAQQLYRQTGYELIAELKDHIVEGHSELLLHKRIS